MTSKSVLWLQAHLQRGYSCGDAHTIAWKFNAMHFALPSDLQLQGGLPVYSDEHFLGRGRHTLQRAHRPQLLAQIREKPLSN